MFQPAIGSSPTVRSHRSCHGDHRPAAASPLLRPRHRPSVAHPRHPAKVLRDTPDSRRDQSVW